MRVAAVQAHRLWAPVYDSCLNPILALERRAMESVLKPLQPCRVVDVACGTGRWLPHLQNAGSQVFGCDACEEMLYEATKNHSLRGRLALADAERLPFRSSVADLILCSLSLGYFRRLDRVFREFARTVTLGGVIAVSDLHPDALAAGWKRSFNVGREKYEIMHYSRALEEIKEAATDAGLRCRSFEEVSLGAAELPIFQRVGRERYFESAKSIAALFIGVWEKPCC